MDFLRNRVNQPSTWRGAVMLLSLAGVTQAEGLVAGISGIVAGAIAIYDIVRNGRPFGSGGA